MLRKHDAADVTCRVGAGRVRAAARRQALRGVGHGRRGDLPRRGDPGRDRALRVRRGRVRGGHHARVARHRRSRDLRRAHRRRPRAGARPPRRQGRPQGRGGGAHRDRDGVAAARCRDAPRDPRTTRSAGPTASTRRADPRIAAQIHAALGDAARVVNVGAGTGNYEPDDRAVVAVEPSRTMLAQRAAGARAGGASRRRGAAVRRRRVRRRARVLTVHHWADLDAGCASCSVSPARQVVFCFEPAWVDRRSGSSPSTSPRSPRSTPSDARPTRERLARVLDVRARRADASCPPTASTASAAASGTGPRRTSIPGCRQACRASRSSTPTCRRRGTERLRADLASGAWDARHGAPPRAGRDRSRLPAARAPATLP